MTKDESSMLLSIKCVGAVLASSKEERETMYSIFMEKRGDRQNNIQSPEPGE